MKLLVYQDFLRVGGTESQSLFLIKKWIQAEGEAILLTNRPRGPLERRLGDLRDQVVSLQQKDYGLNWYAPRLRKTIKSINPDAIVLMGRNANSQGWRIQKWFPELFVLPTFRTGRKVPWMYRKTLSTAPLVHCNSQFVKDRLVSLGVDENRLEVHPNPCLVSRIDKAESNRSKIEVRNRLGIDSDNIVLLNVGAFLPGKNQKELLIAFDKLATVYGNVEFIIIGDGPLRSEISRAIKRMKNGRRVMWLNHQTDMESIYAASDIAISTSLEESMPNFLVESQYMGLPVVAYDESGVNETFDNGSSGFLVERENAMELYSRIEKLVSSTEKRQLMSTNAKEFAKTHFDPDIRFDAFKESLLRSSARFRAELGGKS